MSSTTEQIKNYGELVEALKTTMEALKADHSAAETAFLLMSLEQLLSDVGKDQTAAKAFGDWNQQLKAKEERLQRKEAELQQITLALSMAEESQRLQSRSEELRSAFNGFQSTSNELQSTSKGLELQLQGLKRVASDLATNTTANTEELRRQHKEEIDGLNSIISQLQTKINDWESGHKNRLAEFNAKRQETLANFEEREKYLAAKKEQEMSLKIEALQELRAADQAEARNHKTLRVINELESKKKKIADDIRDCDTSLERWATSFDKAKVISKQQIDRLRGWCMDLHADIRTMDSQIKALEIREGKLPESAHGVLMSGMIGEEPIAEEVTQSTSSKRVHKPSSTSTDQSPRKESAKRVKQAGLSPIDSPSTADVPRRSIPRPSLPTRAPLPPPTPTPTGDETRRTSRIPFATPTRRPPLPNFETAASQARSSPAHQPIPRLNAQGQETSAQAPLAPQAATEENLSQIEVEEGNSAVEPSRAQHPIAGEGGASSPLPLSAEVASVWNQMILDEISGPVDRAQLLSYMEMAHSRKKLTARPERLLVDCANKTAAQLQVCFTSKLRAKGVGNFKELGDNYPCTECGDKYDCLRVRWANDQAQTEVNAEKRWILERR